MPLLHHSTHITYGEIAGLSLASMAMYKFWKIRSDKKKEKERVRLAELTALREHIESLEKDVRSRDEVLTAVRKELEDKRSQLSQAEQLLNGATSTATSMEAKVKSLTKQLETNEASLKRTRGQQEETQKLLKARTQELKGAEVFLTKADTHSGADVISMLNALNTEIYQTAAVVAEAFEFEPRPTPGPNGHVVDPAMAEVYASTTEIVGTRMMELLKSSNHHEDPTLVQIAFQAGMSAYAHWIATSWYFDEPEDDRLLADIYKRLRLQGNIFISLGDNSC
jgi:DNA gyrase/topoisomerase IV subunit A